MRISELLEKGKEINFDELPKETGYYARVSWIGDHCVIFIPHCTKTSEVGVQINRLKR